MSQYTKNSPGELAFHLAIFEKIILPYCVSVFFLVLRILSIKVTDRKKPLGKIHMFVNSEKTLKLHLLQITMWLYLDTAGVREWYHKLVSSFKQFY